MQPFCSHLAQLTNTTLPVSRGTLRRSLWGVRTSFTVSWQLWVSASSGGNARIAARFSLVHVFTVKFGSPNKHLFEVPLTGDVCQMLILEEHSDLMVASDRQRCKPNPFSDSQYCLIDPYYVPNTVWICMRNTVEFLADAPCWSLQVSPSLGQYCMNVIFCCIDEHFIGYRCKTTLMLV